MSDTEIGVRVDQALLDLRRELGVSEIGEFFRDAVCLSASFAEGVGHTEAYTTNIEWRESRGASLKRYNTVIRLDLHATTHAELPWAVLPKWWERAIKSELVTASPPHPRSDAGRELMRSMVEPKVMEAIVIDLTFMRQWLLDALVAAGKYGTPEDTEEDEIKWEPTLLGEDLSGCEPEVIRKLLKNLRISVADLKAAFALIHDPASCIVVFRTGWEVFLPSARYELQVPWHPYYFHPFLDLDCLDLIAELGIAGVAADSSGLSCPMHDMGRQSAPPAMKTVRTEILGAKSSGDISPSLILRPVRLRLLASGSYYITGIHFPLEFDQVGELEAGLSFKNDETVARVESGQLLMVPVPIGGPAIDALPLMLFWRSER